MNNRLSRLLEVSGSAESFCKSFPWRLPIKWMDKDGYAAMSGDRRVRVSLETRGMHDHYEGFRVDILDRNKGKIDSKWFDFNVYLKPAQSSIPNAPRKLEVIAYVQWDWYITRPASMKPIVDAVEGYVKVFE